MTEEQAIGLAKKHNEIEAEANLDAPVGGEDLETIKIFINALAGQELCNGSHDRFWKLMQVVERSESELMSFNDLAGEVYDIYEEDLHVDRSTASKLISKQMSEQQETCMNCLHNNKEDSEDPCIRCKAFELWEPQVKHQQG